MDTERFLRSALVIVAGGGLAAGLAAWWASGPAIANPIWAAATVPVVIALGVEIVVSLSRREVGLATGREAGTRSAGNVSTR